MALQEDDPQPIMTQAAMPDLSSLQASDASQGLSEAQARQQVLNRIASGEANSYNEIYGGHQFTDYSDHPRIAVPITSGPNVGKTSSAAGRYQFLAPTWDDEAKRLQLPDFSPDSQDAAAWDLADRTYRQKTSRSLLADAQAGNVQWGALGGQWESLQGAAAGPGQTKASWGGRSWQGTGQQSSGQQQASGDKTGAAAPDPLLEGLARLHLLQSVFPQHSFTPVAYDPWKYVGKAS